MKRKRRLRHSCRPTRSDNMYILLFELWLIKGFTGFDVRAIFTIISIPRHTFAFDVYHVQFTPYLRHTCSFLANNKEIPRYHRLYSFCKQSKHPRFQLKHILDVITILPKMRSNLYLCDVRPNKSSSLPEPLHEPKRYRLTPQMASADSTQMHAAP